MFPKLAVISLALMSFFAAAQDAPVRVGSIKEASNWIDKIYSSHAARRYTIKLPTGQSGEVFALYAPRGSGIGQLDGWFYSCAIGGTVCDLIAMANLGASRDIKDDPVVTYEHPYLVVNSGSNILLRIKR
jgi:hypothetical protein